MRAGPTRAAAAVVPASAGVFQPDHIRSLYKTSRPRQRGGVPHAEAYLIAVGVSSPPARGCSYGSNEPRRGRAVVPASAGVFPSRAQTSPSTCSRPRQRGGVPVFLRDAADVRESSPPARGCSSSRMLPMVSHSVVPASAGVFQASSNATPATGCRPRQRGGVPFSPACAPDFEASSPPARGCSGSPRSGPTLGPVVPASAGVFLAHAEPRRCDPSRPRQRGGVPVSPRAITQSGVSSPPARGCSCPQCRTRSNMSVVPASAGVFPCQIFCRQPRARRPRQRGGVPVDAT